MSDLIFGDLDPARVFRERVAAQRHRRGRAGIKETDGHRRGHLLRQFPVGDVRPFIEPEHVGPELDVGLRTAQIGKPALEKILFDLEGHMKFLPLIGQFEFRAGRPVPRRSAALDLKAHFDRSVRALCERRESVGLALLARGKMLAELHSPIVNRTNGNQGAGLSVSGVFLIYRKAALCFPGLIQLPAFSPQLKTGIGKEVQGFATCRRSQQPNECQEDQKSLRPRR